jgi:hypothetical protein
MADYYPLIARAVNGLEQNTGENRRVLYERARTALVTQLRGADPPLDESDITTERLGLEEAIRRVEAEAARKAAGAPTPASIEDEFDRFARGNEPSPQRPSGFEHDQDHPSLRDQGLKNFREVVAEAEGLGGATHEAGRSAREFYDHVPGGAHPAPQRDDDDRYNLPPHERILRDEPPAYERHPEHVPEQPAEEDWRPLPETYAEREQPAHDEAAYAPPRVARSYGGLIRTALIVLAVIAVAGIGYWQRGSIMGMVSSFRSQPAQPQQQAQTAPAGRPKIADRIGPQGEISANAPAAAVAQKVVLYDEDPNDPQGKRYVGSAIWRTETVSPGPGLAPELAIRADVEIPERGLRMTWSLRRNTDKALPASHTIEILFTLAADFPEGGISNVPGVLMKQNEQARGVPLAGLAVKVTNGYFLIGLSAAELDIQRNIQLLKERDWFDIPIVYNTNKRGILAVEKGDPGVRVFEEAFRAWGQ